MVMRYRLVYVETTGMFLPPVRLRTYRGGAAIMTLYD